MALAGDAGMLRLIVSTLVSTRRDRTVEFELPKIETAADVRTASSSVLAACARGELSPNEASEILTMISAYVRTIKEAEFEERIAALEMRQAK